MDAGNPAVRWAAWCVGWCLRTVYLAWRGMLRAWALFGGERLLLNTMALTVVGCGSLLVWWSVLEPIVPLQSADVLEPASGEVEVDRDVTESFRVTRRICMKRGAWAHISRYYIGSDGGGIEYKIAPRDSLFLPAGCHVRSRAMEIPRSLPPGMYVYRSSVEFCGRLRCEDGWAQEIQVKITGRWPLEAVLPPGIFRSPP